MSLEAKNINLDKIIDSKIPKVTTDKGGSQDLSVRNDKDINVPTEAFVPGTPLSNNAIWENARQTRRDGANVDTVQDAITQDRQNSEDAKSYTVKSGDTMWDIAESLKDTGNYKNQTVPEIVQNVADYNGIADPSKIYVGQKIFFPSEESAETAPIITPENNDTTKTDTTKTDTTKTDTTKTDTTKTDSTQNNQPAVNKQNIQNANVINNNYYINGAKVNQPPQINNGQNGINNNPTYGDQVIIVIINNNQPQAQPAAQTNTAAATKETKKSEKSDKPAFMSAANLKKGKKEFSWGNLFSNIGKGIWNEIKGIGKALTTPMGLLTAAGLIGLSILCPPAGLAIAGGFLAYGIGKTAYAGYEIAKDYSDGKYEEAEKHGEDLGAGLLDTALAAIGFRGALNAFKASRAASAASKAASGSSASETASGTVSRGPVSTNTRALPPGEEIRALPAPETTTGTGTGTGATGGGSGGTGNAKALPPGSNGTTKALPNNNSTGAGSKTTTGAGTGTNKALPNNTAEANTSAQGVKGNVNTANTSSLFSKFKAQIDGADDVKFLDNVGGRRTMSTVKNPYKVLGLDKNNFDPSKLKSSYRELSRMFHPDKNPGLSDSYMQNVNKAYEILSDPVKKAELDFSLRSR